MKQAIITFTDNLYNPVYFPLREMAEGADFPPSQWAKVCPFCLDPWARLHFGQDHYHIHAVPCQNCTVTNFWLPNIPGSLVYDTSYQATDWDLLDDLPQSLLQREFTIHLRHFDRNTFMLTPEELSKLQLYRARISAGEQMPLEELQESIKLLRADRMNAAARAQASKAKGKKAKKAPADAGALLGQLGIKFGAPKP